MPDTKSEYFGIFRFFECYAPEEQTKGQRDKQTDSNVRPTSADIVENCKQTCGPILILHTQKCHFVLGSFHHHHHHHRSILDV